MDFIMQVLSDIFKIDEHINNNNRNGYDEDDIVHIDDIEYAKDKALDVYYSTRSDAKMPVVINVHGGGWLVGDKKWRKGISRLYAHNGIFVVNPNYGLSPGELYPACVRDIFAVIDFLVEHENEYNIDLDRLYMTGDSAGSHIAAVVCAVQDKQEVLDRMSIAPPKRRISKVALFCGVYDYDMCAGQVGASGLVKEMTGCDFASYKEKFEFARELSPINYIDSNFPPTYLVSAPLDIFCGGQAERLSEKLDYVKVKYIHYIPEDKYATHCFHLNLNREDSMEAIRGAIDFFLDNGEGKETEG